MAGKGKVLTPQLIDIHRQAVVRQLSTSELVATMGEIESHVVDPHWQGHSQLRVLERLLWEQLHIELTSRQLTLE